MENDSEINLIDKKQSGNPLILAMLGIGIAGFCGAFLAAFLLFQPDQLSQADIYFPSPTATSTPTRTPTPTHTPTSTATFTPTPNLTATQKALNSRATAQVMQALIADSLKWHILLIDPFGSNKNKWTIGNTDSEYSNITREIRDGKYKWDVTSKKPMITQGNMNLLYTDNFRLSLEGGQTSGTVEFDFGLIFRKYVGDYYYFGINNKEFFVSLYHDGQWTDMLSPARSPAILPNKTNRLTVVAKGSYFMFFINDQFVGEMTDEHIEKGTVAIAVEINRPDARATFEFDNLELRAP